MPSSHFDSNADDRHDRDFTRFRRDERQRFPVVSIREECPEIPKPQPEKPEEEEPTQ